jgi:succinate dehydrogenase flavin-adding protein (antitoxin of CptAB toxin-antitoxin module)
MKELDLLLERFARERYAGASEGQKAAFASLLELPDPLLAEYFFGHAVPDEPQLAEVTGLITAPRV